MPQKQKPRRNRHLEIYSLIRLNLEKIESINTKITNNETESIIIIIIIIIPTKNSRAS